MGLTLARNDNEKPEKGAVFRPVTSVLAELRAQVRSLEGSGGQAASPEGEGSSDRAMLAENGPQQPGLYELWAVRPVDIAAAQGLLLAWLGSGEGPILWVTSQQLVREYGLPYGPGLLAQGIDPARVVLVRAREMQGALWAVEEGLRSGVLSAVVGECGGLDLTASRRLALVAREQMAKCLMIVRTPEAPASAAHMRWRVTPSASGQNAHHARAPGFTRLHAELVKDRGGLPPHTHELEWHHATHHFRVAAPLAGRTLAPEHAAGLATG